ncbi:MAG: hypothetical protein IKQ60_00085 [Candidatus Methanomethylophilaceae archaeon]|nr:hypothetical protein [Candidatus Methanomethylophilaceae archaeon]
MAERRYLDQAMKICFSDPDVLSATLGALMPGMEDVPREEVREMIGDGRICLVPNESPSAGEGARNMDLVLSIEVPNMGRWLLDLEFQSNSTDFGCRSMGYLERLWKEAARRRLWPAYKEVKGVTSTWLALFSSPKLAGLVAEFVQEGRLFELVDESGTVRREDKGAAAKGGMCASYRCIYVEHPDSCRSESMAALFAIACPDLTPHERAEFYKKRFNITLSNEIMEALKGMNTCLADDQRDQCIEEGRMMGLEEGMEKGMQEGMEKGLAKRQADLVEEVADMVRNRSRESGLSVEEALEGMPIPPSLMEDVRRSLGCIRRPAEIRIPEDPVRTLAPSGCRQPPTP